MKTLLKPAFTISLALFVGACSSSSESSVEVQLNNETDFVQDAQLDESLRAQQTAMLVREHVTRARQAYADARLLEAEDDLLAALRLNASATEAIRLLERVQIALGRTNTDITGSNDDVLLRAKARGDRLQADARANLEEARQLRAAGNYEASLGRLNLASSIVGGSDLNVDWGSLSSDISILLGTVTSERDAALSNQREEATRESFNALQQERKLEVERQSLRRNGILEEAIYNFEAGKYDKTIALTAALIEEDPLNTRAEELHSAAEKSRHLQLEDEWVKTRAERYLTWIEDIEEARILITDIVTLPNTEHWRKINELRKKYRELPDEDENSAENNLLQEEIAIQRIPSLVFEGETSLETVIDQLRTFTSIPYIVTPDAIAAVDDEGIEFNLTMTHELSVEHALNIITDAAGPDVIYSFRYGVVYITTLSNAFNNLVLRPHDIRDLTAMIVDQAAPQIDRIQLPDSSFSMDEEELPMGGPVGEPVPIMDPDNIATLVQQSVATGTWDSIEGVSIQAQNGQLFVRHTPEVHREIAIFLEGFRRYTSSMVNIEAKFLTITKDYLQEIGVDWRGARTSADDGSELIPLDDISSGFDDNASSALDDNGLGLPSGSGSNPTAGAYYSEGEDGSIRARSEGILSDYGSRLGVTGGLAMQLSFIDDLQYSLIMTAVRKDERAQELTSVMLSTQNSQRAYAAMLNQITYIQDFDVEVALASFIADPVIGVISDGIVLDVRPTIAQDRKTVSLELRPTIATILRPIAEFTSSLAGLTTPITIQLPELQVASVKTTVVVPDGGTVVIGGLKKLFNIDQRAEIPFLSDIPILSLLFKKVGEASENRDVILMITATIIDANELKDRLEVKLGN
jgi:Flp pilus assembly secretin CpaC/tetratricopeptide (TPR) repeat protein